MSDSGSDNKHPLKTAIESGVEWCRQNDVPVPKYVAVVKITGNSRRDIESAIYRLSNDWVEYADRDEIDSTDGTTSVVMQHTNPEQTPEAYDEQLLAWSKAVRS